MEETVKFGDYSNIWRSTWTLPFEDKIINPLALIVFIMLLLLLGLFAVLKPGLGLRLKLTAFALSLVLPVIFLAFLPVKIIFASAFVVLAFGITGALILSSKEFTHNLIKTVSREPDMLIGRELQKKLLPLKIDEYGNKLNYGYKDTENAFFYGYYEGAKEVSGDYIDYQDLDGRYYAVIKCDVAGKGIPAAMLMMQVAAMFLNYFKQWKPNIQGTNIEEIVYQINGFIEKVGFKGRFAAFSLCLFDSLNGDIHFCNAGDNIIRILDSGEKCIKKITLPQSPAAGVFTNDLVELKGGYNVQTLTLKPGDILLLYTDGIEESRRKLKNRMFKNIAGTEEFGAQRAEKIINAVMNRQTFSLKKLHDPEGDVSLQFDFSGCKGNMGELIIALISVEKMFRCYKDPKAAKDDLVMVDKKVDSFLKKTFLQYQYYCSNTSECPQDNAYIYYTQLKEDEQYDDLTILGIQRKL